MPIRLENRWLYPIDWPALSAAIRFGRAGARCERCGRPHRRHVVHLGDGRWWDAGLRLWRSGRGRRIARPETLTLEGIRTTFVVLACAHLDHDPGHNTPANLAALCQRCHMLHDAEEHRWQRWWNGYRLRAIRDLFEDPRLTRRRLAHRRSAVLAGSPRSGRSPAPRQGGAAQYSGIVRKGEASQYSSAVRQKGAIASRNISLNPTLFQAIPDEIG